MGTSRSASPARTWTAGIYLFSGRRDPTWPVAQGAVDALEALWQKLDRTETPWSQPPPLGYRGAFVRDDQGAEFIAYRGAVLRRSGTKSEVRSDPERRFERAIIDAAPPEAVPPPIRALIEKDGQS